MKCQNLFLGKMSTLTFWKKKKKKNIINKSSGEFAKKARKINI